MFNKFNKKYASNLDKVSKYQFGENDKKFFAATMTVAEMAPETVIETGKTLLAVPLMVPLAVAVATYAVIDSIGEQMRISYDEYCKENGTQI